MKEAEGTAFQPVFWPLAKLSRTTRSPAMVRFVNG